MEVGKLRADIELLELTADYLKGRIKDALPLISQLEEDVNYQATNADAQKLESDRRKQKAAKVRAKVELWRKEYSEAKERIARYRYRIEYEINDARFPMSESGDSSESLAEVVRRLDRLEAKVDRIAKSIATRGGGR